MNVYQLVKLVKHLSNQTRKMPSAIENNQETFPVLSLNMESCLGNQHDSIPDSTKNSTPNSTQYSIQNSKKDIQVSLCLYRQNEHSVFTNDNKTESIPIEFLSYYMELSDKHEFGFPSFTYHLDDVHDDPDDEDVDPFKETCIENILRIFAMEQIPRSRSVTPDNMKVNFGYRGMVTHENRLFVFFNMNVIEQFFRPAKTHYVKHPCVWAVVDEIVKKHSIFSINIEPQIVELFIKRPMVWNISHDGIPLAFPRAMYSVVPSAEHHKEKEKHNTEHKDHKDETYDYKTAVYSPSLSKKSRVKVPSLPFAHSDLFAERFLFTSKPIPSANPSQLENGLPAYKRYVVFLYHPKFLFSQKYKSHQKWLNDYPQNFVENMDPEDDDQVEEYRNIPCICFSQKLKHHKVTEFWGLLHDDLFAEISRE